MTSYLDTTYKSKNIKYRRTVDINLELFTLLSTQRLLAFDFGNGIATVNKTITWRADILLSSSRFYLDKLEE